MSPLMNDGVVFLFPRHFIASLRAIEYIVAICYTIRTVYYIASIKYLMKHGCYTYMKSNISESNLSAQASAIQLYNYKYMPHAPNKSFDLEQTESDNLFG